MYRSTSERLRPLVEHLAAIERAPCSEGAREEIQIALDAFFGEGVVRAVERGVSLVTVHGDHDIIRAAVEGRRGSDLRILAITVLTSIDDAGAREMGYLCPVEELIRHRVAAGPRLRPRGTGPVREPVANDEERCVSPVTPQDIEDARRVQAGAVVEGERDGIAAAAPSGPNSTSSSAAGVASIVHTASAPPAASAGEAARRAPFCTAGRAFSAVRFHTVTSWPASTSRMAIGSPIRPRPRNAIWAAPLGRMARVCRR